MALMLSEVYDALRAAQVPEGVARDAAHALGEVSADVRLLKWMVGTNVVVTVALLGAIGGLYGILFSILGRLPR